MDNITYKDVINRLGFFRNMAKKSIRDTSLCLGYNPQFVKTIESGKIELKVSTLLDFCEVVGINILDFFYLGDKYDPKHKEVLELFRNLSDEHKNLIIDLMKALKK